jgi:hypothetical protein
MPSKPSITPNVALELLQRLVADHGESFRFSISKAGRAWVTLTHWGDDVKYNTACELDTLDVKGTFDDALTLMCVAHYAKCIKGAPSVDSWYTVDRVRSLAPEASTLCADYLAGNGSAESAVPSPAAE